VESKGAKNYTIMIDDFPRIYLPYRGGSMVTVRKRASKILRQSGADLVLSREAGYDCDYIFTWKEDGRLCTRQGRAYCLNLTEDD